MAPDDERPCGAHDARLTNLEIERKEFRDDLERVKNRLPNWAVLVIAGLSGALGWSMQIVYTTLTSQ